MVHSLGCLVCCHRSCLFRLKYETKTTEEEEEEEEEEKEEVYNRLYRVVKMSAGFCSCLEDGLALREKKNKKKKRMNRAQAEATKELRCTVHSA